MGPSRDSLPAPPVSAFRAPATMLLFAVSLVLSLLAGDGFLPFGQQRLYPDQPTIESLLTSHLVHVNVLHALLTLTVVLLAGGVVENRLGTSAFVCLYLLGAWGSALATALSAQALGVTGYSCGASGVALGFVVVLGQLYPDHRLLWHLPAMRHVVWAVIFLGAGGLILLDASQDGRTFLLPQVTAVGFGIGFLILHPWVRLVAREVRARREARNRERILEIRGRVDELLEKISTIGIESLTSRERAFLRHASKHFRAASPTESRRGA